jgi:hypothetical protein
MQTKPLLSGGVIDFVKMANQDIDTVAETIAVLRAPGGRSQRLVTLAGAWNVTLTDEEAERIKSFFDANRQRPFSELREEVLREAGLDEPPSVGIS